MTNANLMLEQADQSGRVDPDDFDEYTIERLFRLNGIRMLIIDAILANENIHTGSFGWLRDTNTGEYISMALLYGFNHVPDSKLNSDNLLIDTAKVVKRKPEYVEEVLRICSIISGIPNISTIFKLRAKKI